MSLCVLIFVSFSCPHRYKNSKQKQIYSAPVEAGFMRERENIHSHVSVHQPTWRENHLQCAREICIRREARGRPDENP